MFKLQKYGLAVRNNKGIVGTFIE